MYFGNSSSAAMRAFEKEHRIKELGSARSQTAFDEAVEKLTLAFDKARKEMLRIVLPDEDDYLFILSKRLFASSLAGDSYAETHQKMKELLAKAEAKATTKKNPNGKDTDPDCVFYRDCLAKMDALGEEKTLAVMAGVRNWFWKAKNDRNIPYVRKAWVRADSRAHTFEKSKGIDAPYVLSVTTTVGGKRTDVPLWASPDSLRRLEQYGHASTITYSVKENGRLLVSVAVKKKVAAKSKKGVFVGADAGIIDVIAASDGKYYGSLLPAQKFYDDEVLKHVGRKQALENLMRKTRMLLRKTVDKGEKNRLRQKICHINTMLQQNKVVGRSLNRYDAIVDREIHDVVEAFVADRLKDLAVSVFEALDIRNFDRDRKSNRRDSMWARGKLLRRLKEALAWAGLSFVEIEPSYTSQICPKCGHLERANRDGKIFKCVHCGHEDDADHNAALNILERTTNKELMAILAKPATLRQRQAAIHEWYAAKEKAYDEAHGTTTITVSSA